MLYRVIVLLVISALLLSGCFRDAGEDRETTNVNVQEILTGSPTVATTPSPTVISIATLTPTPQGIPSNTPAPGGPPIATSTRDSSTATRQPATVIASFTPSGDRGEQFGDPGIVATSNLPTLEAPEALITPTAPPTEMMECVYIVQANDTLTSIATAYEVTVDDMVAANPELGGNPGALLQIGQELNIAGCVPSATAEAEDTEEPETTTGSQTPTVAAPAGTITYTVKDGDNLFRIALNHNTTVDAIFAANPELGGSTLIQPGQVLIIPTGQE